MSDTSNPAPAAAGSSDTRPSEGDILSKLAQFGDDGQNETEFPAADEAQADTDPDEAQETNEPEGDEVEDASEPEQDGEDEEPSDDADEPEPKEAPAEDPEADDRKFRLRDRTEVTLGDLKKGFDRARELETKILPAVQQRLAAATKLEQDLAAQQQQFQATAAGLAQWAIGKLPEAPDPAMLRQDSGKYDPIGFYEQSQLRQMAEAELNQHLQQVQYGQQQLSAKQKADHEAALQNSRQQAIARYVQMRPELNEPEKAKAFAEGRQRVAQYLGYSPQEISDIHDPRLLEAIRLSDYALKKMAEEQKTGVVKTQQQAIAAKKVVTAPPVAKPAARQSAAARDASMLRGTVERLRKNPSSTEAQLAALAQFD